MAYNAQLAEEMSEEEIDPGLFGGRDRTPLHGKNIVSNNITENSLVQVCHFITVIHNSKQWLCTKS